MKNLLIKSILFFFFIHLCFLESYQYIQDEKTTPILTPSFKKIKTAKIHLVNGLEAYLISDPEAEKSSSSLVVRAGSWSDPEEYPGLAHFLEHMLFLGTKKYPIESEYHEYIRQNNGLANAYTAPDHTCYSFAIPHEAFQEAFDRFSEFFKEPLFHPSGVSRELKAIDQEFAKNLENDLIRYYYVTKKVCNQEHPHKKFTIGNKSTLEKATTDVLKKWYLENYSANLMHLVLYSPLPLETQKQMVIDHFQTIRNTYKKPLEISCSLYDSDEKMKIVYIEPIKKIKRLHLVWEIPSLGLEKHTANSPASFLSFLVGHESEGSLTYYLKKSSLAEKLECGSYCVGNSALFSLQIDLTKEGLNEIKKVIEISLAAMQYYLETKVPEYLVEEYQTMSEIRYQYPEREEAFQLTTEYAALMMHEDLRTFPEKTFLAKNLNKTILETLKKSLKVSSVKIFLLASSLDMKKNYDLMEPWTKTAYTQEDFILKTNELVLPAEISYPEKNPFIPYQLRLLKDQDSSKPIPDVELIVDHEAAKIYYAKDQYFGLPKMACHLEIQSLQLEGANPLKEVLADVFVRFLQEKLLPFSYHAKLAGLNYSIEKVEKAIRLSIDGYSEKVGLLLEAIGNEMASLSPTEQEIHGISEFLQCQYENGTLASPLQYGLEILQNTCSKNSITKKDKLSYAHRINPYYVKTFLSSLFSKTFIKGIFYGNLRKEDAKNFFSHFEKSISSVPFKEEERKGREVILFPEKEGPFYIESKTKALGNAAILAIETVPFSFKTRAAQQIFSQAISAPFFSHLRTKQQTGYIVANRAEDLERHLFTLFMVQSNTHDPRDLLSRFELLIEEFIQEMKMGGFSKDAFETTKEALVSQIKCAPKNMEDVGRIFKQIIFQYGEDFSWYQKRIQGFENLSYEEFLQMVNLSFGKNNKRRFSVLIKGIIPEQETLRYSKLPHVRDIRTKSYFSTGEKEIEKEENLSCCTSLNHEN